MAKEPENEELEAAEEKLGTSALRVHDRHGRLARIYSVADHGKRTKEYAEEYAKKIGGEVRKG